MKRNFWICLLVFSLALNLGGLATFAYLRYQYRASPGEPTQLQPFREMWGPLNLEPGQKQALGSLLPEHRRRVQDLRRELAQKRRDLFDLTKEGAAAWPAIQGKVREVSDLQGKIGRGGAAVLPGLSGAPETGAESRVHRFHGASHGQCPRGQRPPASQVEERQWGLGRPRLPGPAVLNYLRDA